MKIRQGFVSNSSSSSFVFFVKKQDYNKLLSELSELGKEVMKCLNPKNKKAFGETFVCIHGMTGNSSSFYNFSFDIDDEEEKQRFEDIGAEGYFCDIIQPKLEKLEHLSSFNDC